VFDSGVGGLSILKALRTELPHEDFVYVADSGFAPYGERDEGFVVERSRSITRYLLDQNHLPIKALVIACNTATGAAIHLLRQDHPELPIIGVEPSLKPAIAISRNKRIGVMATRGTLNSRKFQTLLASLSDQAQFVCQPCEGLADAIERYATEKIATLCIQYTQALGAFGIAHGAIDTLVLGCTHYPFERERLQSLVGPEVALIDNGEPVARQTRRRLKTLNEPEALGQLTLLTTGQAQALSAAAQRWLQLDIQASTLQF
jgi:glutamate racemase